MKEGENELAQDGLPGPPGAAGETLRLPPQRFRRSAPIGRLDRYVLLRQLGAGGFGAVYLARDSEADIEVALKLIPAVVASNPDELEAIRDNFRLVAKLRHPNIANVLHLHTVEYVDTVVQATTGVGAGDRLVVMDYVQGITLVSWRRQFPDGVAPFDQALAVAAQIAEGLDYAHSRQIIHRDIKPANVMINAAGEVRILDFGLAAQVRASLTQASCLREDVCGTPAYMPPEQWAGRQQGPASDQYCLAVLIYEMLAGSVPFASAFATNDHQVMYAAVKNEPPETLAKLDRKVNAVLLRGLAKQPEDRFPTCTDLVAALGGRKWRRHSLPRRTKTTPDAHSPPRRRSLLVALATQLLLVGLVVLLTLQARHLANPPEAAIPAAGLADSAGQLLATIQDLLAGARSAAKGGDLQTAEALVARVLQLQPGNAEAVQLRLSLAHGLGLADVVPIKSEAETKWQQTAAFERGQGVGEVVDRGNAVLAAANILFEAGEYRQALERYNQVLGDYERLQAMTRDRATASNEKTNGEAARQRAAGSGATADNNPFFAGAEKLMQSAAAAFERGGFAEAARLWITAAAEFSKAQAQAMGNLAASLARKSYEDKLAEYDLALLDQWGGAVWQQVRLTIGEAERLAREGQWDEAVKRWERAKGTLPAALAAAVEARDRPAAELGAAKSDSPLSAALAAQAEAKAEAARAAGNWEAVRRFALEALKHTPDSPAAKALLAQAREVLSVRLDVIAVVDEQEVGGAEIFLDGAATGEKTPATLALEQGREYQLRVVLPTSDARRLYLPFETTFNARRQEGATLRAVLRPSPLPADLLPLPDAPFAPLAGLAVGSREAQERLRQFAGNSQLPPAVRSAVAGLPFRLVPAGVLERQLPGDGARRQRLTVGAFYISEHEITRGQWAKVMHGDGQAGAVAEPQAENLPMTDVSWDDCQEFCRRLAQLEQAWNGSYRLPTEAEWEYACRAGVDGRYLSGDDEPALRTSGWYAGNSEGKLQPVGQMQGNAWNLYGFHGNAAEWVQDWLGEYPAGEWVDHAGPQTGTLRVIRGGSVLLPAAAAAFDWRDGLPPATRRPDLGFRIVRTLNLSLDPNRSANGR